MMKKNITVYACIALLGTLFISSCNTGDRNQTASLKTAGKTPLDKTYYGFSIAEHVDIIIYEITYKRVFLRFNLTLSLYL